jgi:hypothetical protein
VRKQVQARDKGAQQQGAMWRRFTISLLEEQSKVVGH